MSDIFDIVAPLDQTLDGNFELLRWIKSIGDEISKDEPLLEIETDKVTTEVAAPVSGLLFEILKREEEQVSPGEVLGRIRVIKQTQTSDNEGPTDSLQSAADPDYEWIVASSNIAKKLHPESASSKQMSLSPAVRRLLKERRLNPAAITGTGVGGRITVDDVLSHQMMPNPLKSAEERAEVDGYGVETHSSEIGRTRYIRHSATRRRIASHMVHSLLHTAPHVSAVMEADLSKVDAHRSNNIVQFGERGAPLTYTSYFIAATVKAIRAVPESNSRWTQSHLEVYEPIHMGIATNIRGIGLVVPVLRNVELLDLFGIASELHKLVGTAQKGKLRREDVRYGTFTISNYGVDGCLFASPVVINQPQSAILGVGAIEDRVVMAKQEAEKHLTTRRKCYVTLTIDHRVMDGYRAGRFLDTLVRTLREWPPIS